MKSATPRANCEISAPTTSPAETHRRHRQNQNQIHRRQIRLHSIRSEIISITTSKPYKKSPTMAASNTSINLTKIKSSTIVERPNHHNHRHTHHQQAPQNNQKHRRTMLISQLAQTTNCYTLFLLSLLSLSISSCLSSTINMHNNNQANSISAAQDATGQIFTCGKLYYRTFHLDQQRNVLYVGAMDNLFKVNLANINKTNCLEDAIRLEPSDTQKCITKGKSESFDCRNHIKVIQPMTRLGDKLYVCGTNAYNPRDYLVHAGNLSVSGAELAGGGMGPSGAHLGVGGPAQAECPFDPDDNSTAIWVNSGNPSDAPALYTGTATDFNKADPLIFRTELYNQTSGQKIHEAKRTTKYDSKWLDKPNFVGSFEIGDYVYFFFRENAVEYINCGKSIYSRVARVCKRDNGFKPAMYEKVWTTFLKARLNCSIPGEFPFYFDEIQSIYRNPFDEHKFHAVFTTSQNGLAGSAICSFSLEAIQEAFNGKFKEQQSSTAAWLPVPSYKLNQNEPRPGTCVDDTQALSDNLVTFIRGHPLMDSAVANDNNRPVFYRRDIMFTKIVVDVIEIDGVRYTVYFVGTNTGHVYKIVEWPGPTMGAGGGPLSMENSSGGGSPSMGGFLSALSDAISSSSSTANNNAGGSSQQSSGGSSQQGGAHPNLGSQATLVEVIEATVPEPVRAMELSSRHKSLYVASDSIVRQINLLNCKQRHDSCMQCVRDPYCGWDRKHLECKHFSSIDSASLIQDITNESPDLCHSVIKHKDVYVNWGQSVHLPCKFNGFIQESQDLQQLLAAQQRQSVQQQQLHLQRLSAGNGVGGSLTQPAASSMYSGAGGLQGPQLTASAAAMSAAMSSSTGDSYLRHASSLAGSQPHGLVQPAQYIQWYYHRRDNVLSPGYPVLQRRDKFILAADQGLVIMNANEPGWYQCRLGNQIIHSYNLIIDTKTCAAPNEQEFKRIYADWCREIEHYKSAYRNWHAKQNRCQAFNANQQQHHTNQGPVMMARESSGGPPNQQVAGSGDQSNMMWTTHNK
uniref:Semaphorin-2A n=2 Tax=Aceria tosichella TaxID=561515 RepID=A0A6G1SMH5_9ACAR